MIEKVRIDRRWLPLNALRAFEGVARYGSFTGAASALNIAQSALSRHVISLENLIGVKLFERRPHSLLLTAAGEHLLPVVSRSFDRLEHAIDEIRDARTPRLRTLRVQMPPSFAAHMMVPLLQDFRADHPEVEIDLVSPYGIGPPAADVDIAVLYT
jgi:LysR family glycine cleavage system transcriptional activator